ncbi:MAG: CaiB/BaiF CoA-transferase family protein, partial [candidate division KSB1 bacterium]|nr:CaiB/BaiF CoA-transferase family protein [candidate division KSB1 bacterium]
SLDFDSQEGREQLMELIRSADVLVEQFRPGVMQQLGLDYESVRQHNPKLIYVSLTGYGQSGPMAQQAGHDINYIGYAGVLALTGSPKTGPVLPGVQIADVAGGAYWLIIRTLAALWQRQRTGAGQHVDVAMLEGVLPLITLQWAQYRASGQHFGPGEHPLAGGLANYNVYRCKDGKYVALGALEQKFWEGFCDLVERPEWKPLHFAMGKEGERLKKALQKLFQQRTRDEWLTLAEGKDVCLSPVLGVEEMEALFSRMSYEMVRRLFADLK